MSLLGWQRIDVHYIDATIAGSSEQARRGEAVVVVGGANDDVHRATPILESWSPRRFHVGPIGSGQRMKLVVESRPRPQSRRTGRRPQSRGICRHRSRRRPRSA